MSENGVKGQNNQVLEERCRHASRGSGTVWLDGYSVYPLRVGDESDVVVCLSDGIPKMILISRRTCVMLVVPTPFILSVFLKRVVMMCSSPRLRRSTASEGLWHLNAQLD